MSEQQEEKIILANWKANFSPSRAAQWCEEFSAAYQPVAGMEVVIAVPFLCMEEVGRRLNELEGVSLAAQTVSPYPQGSYSGSTPAAWLRGLAKYALLGHRERRDYFHETAQDVAKQVYESLAEELVPIVCVDQDNINAQTAIFDTEDLLKIRWAYTPKDAEQLERAHGNQSIETAVSSISKKVGHQPVLYGGGVNNSNGGQILELPGVQGIMLGRGCLDAAAFAKLVQSV
ncbi:triose-phosphate isomerase [Desulfogranum marinum]|uniref:triose-phosphate isomerase n=1 Tax=Desulfogranum marinum TaxID=453220 RepID=UPI0019641E2A|nr:triose-phosphate isomerase family protein [Desulfogranum marinum]MBM9514541.1 triosephosphate isomerase [Desulfogranum marinum]